MLCFIFVLGPVVVAEKQNSTKTTNKNKVDDVPLNMNSTAVYNHNYDPNIPSTKSA